LSVSTKVQSCIHVSLIDIKVWLLVFQAALYQSLFLSRLDFCDWGRQNSSQPYEITERARAVSTKWLAERVLLLCFSALQNLHRCCSAHLVLPPASQLSHHDCMARLCLNIW
jgi:hypothetical protein